MKMLHITLLLAFLAHVLSACAAETPSPTTRPFPERISEDKAEVIATEIAARYEPTNNGEGECFSDLHSMSLTYFNPPSDDYNRSVGGIAHVCERVSSDEYAMQIACGLLAVRQGRKMSEVCEELRSVSSLYWVSLVNKHPRLVDKMRP